MTEQAVPMRPDAYRMIIKRAPDGSRLITGREPIYFGQRRLTEADQPEPNVVTEPGSEQITPSAEVVLLEN